MAQSGMALTRVLAPRLEKTPQKKKNNSPKNKESTRRRISKYVPRGSASAWRKRSKEGRAENNSGSGPATSASHETSASEIDGEVLGATSEDLYSAAALEIEREFQRRLLAARRLFRRDRPLAVRIAREWRREALNALTERRPIERLARTAHRRAARLSLIKQSTTQHSCPS
jgi:hypothetical protein